MYSALSSICVISVLLGVLHCMRYVGGVYMMCIQCGLVGYIDLAFDEYLVFLFLNISHSFDVHIMPLDVYPRCALCLDYV